MSVCEKCKVNIIGDRKYCPLCQSELKGVEDTDGDVFPIIFHVQHKYHLLLRVLAFLSMIVSVLSIFFNVIFFKGTWWSIFVIATIVCAWISLVITIYKGKNILKNLLYQSIIISLFAIFLDYFIQWKAWSISFVIPIVFTLAMIVMYTLSKILHLHVGDYMIYLLLDALFGIIPIIFIATSMIQIRIPSFICIITSIISVSALIIFEGQTMYNELKRRLHI